MHQRANQKCEPNEDNVTVDACSKHGCNINGQCYKLLFEDSLHIAKNSHGIAIFAWNYNPNDI